MADVPHLNLPKKRTFIGTASYIKRFVAFIIDFMIAHLLVLLPFSFVYAEFIPADAQFSEILALSEQAAESPVMIGLSLFTGFFVLMYFTLLEWKVGQTIGKKLFGLQVSSDQKKIKPITFFQAIVRNLLFIPLFPFSLLWIVDVISLGFSKTGQRFLERTSKTYTVQTY